MKNITSIVIFIFFAINLNANVLIYNYTPEILTASFYYGDNKTNMVFTVNIGESTESGIPSLKLPHTRKLKISTKNGKELILKPLEWFTDKTFYIVAENNILKGYSQSEWNNLSGNVQGSLMPEEKTSFFSSTHTYESKETELEITIPNGANTNDWTLISNQYDTKIYAAFYYKGTLTNNLTKAPAPIYVIKAKSAGYAKLPPVNFLKHGARVIAYADQPTALTETIKKENYETIKGIVAVGVGEGSIALLGAESNNPEIKKSIKSIKTKSLNIVLKNDTTLYYALYQPIYKGLRESITTFFTKGTKEIERFQRYTGPEKMIPNNKITTAGADTALIAFSANSNSLSESLTKSILEGSKDINYIRCKNNEYLIVAKPKDTIFIYTPEQWKEALSRSADFKKSYTTRFKHWLINKFTGIKK